MQIAIGKCTIATPSNYVIIASNLFSSRDVTTVRGGVYSSILDGVVGKIQIFKERFSSISVLTGNGNASSDCFRYVFVCFLS